MDFQGLVSKRYSVRAYRSDPVPEAVLRRVLEAAVLAPTAANRQPFRLIVMRTEGKEQELLRVYKRDWFGQAPVVVCACAVPNGSWQHSEGKRFSDVDVAIVVDHLTLAATSEGLGTCWVAAFDLAAAREVFDVPAEAEPLILIPIGYAADTPRPKTRKGFEELVRFQGF